MRLKTLAIAALAASAVSAAAPAQPAEPAANFAAIQGVWRNHKDSVHVDIRACGQAACGYVIWANAKAQADAKKGGTDNLIGLQLLRNLEPQKGGIWKGRVFVPDLNATFTGTAIPVDATTLKARGCLFANVLCKEQIWTRVS
jgi:uncharacterized protein (DUF2147 family)